MIRKEDVKDLYPLSPMQEGMLFHSLYDARSTAYFEQLSFRIAGPLERAAFDAALGEVFRRHDVLRTVFVHENARRPLQIVLKDAPPRIGFDDLSGLPPGEQSAGIARWRETDRGVGFRLDLEPPVRIHLFQLDDRLHEAVWSHHHILMDGWCQGILQHEFLAIYAALTAGTPHGLAPARPYSAYIKWLEGRGQAAAKAFWADYLAGYDELTPLPRKASGTSYRLAACDTALDPATIALLHRCAAEARVSISTLVHAVWGVLLGKYNDSGDAVFGSVISNRPEEIEGIERMVGLFINTVPVRVAWDAETTFAELLARTHSALLRRAPHEFLPLADIQAASPLKGDVFDHLMLVQNFPFEESAAGQDAADFRVGSFDLFEHTHYPFTVSLEMNSGIGVKFAYDAEQFAAGQVDALLRHFLSLLATFLADPGVVISRVALAGGIVSGSPAAPSETTLVAMFEQSVRRHPAKIALECQDRSLTYAEIDRLSDGVAAHLTAHFDIQPDDRIALIAGRSEFLVAGMLGIAKTGAAYVPIDPAGPPERIELVLAGSGCKLALIDPCPDPGLAPALAGIPVADLRRAALSGSPPVGAGPKPGNLLYVAYTSGSTGLPKGVMIEHRNVAAFAAYLPATFGIGPADSLLAITTFTFDISVLELLCSLVHGLRVCVATADEAADPALVLALLERRNITVLQATPSRLATLLDTGGWGFLERLRILLVGGEPMPSDLFEKLRRVPGLRVFNVYGPTETTIWSTALRLGDGPLTIGRPLPGESVVILSREGHAAPAGIVGEICIAGTGLGRGYLNREDLTRDRYIEHPFEPGERLYRTGDLGKWRFDGEIEILGRRDDQVKIRGFRVELGEIESALRACPDVKQAVVAVRANEVIAYVTAGAAPDAGNLRAMLVRTLPAYMIPSHIVFLDHMPLLPSGKTDRKALPPPDRKPEAALPQAPRDATERKLAAIWESVLNRQGIGAFDNFFEIGGHSLKATQALSRIHKDLHAKVRLRDLFAAPTLAGLAALVRRKTPSAYREIEPVADAASYELSHAQRRMWVLDRMAPEAASYIIAAAFSMEGCLDTAAFQRALDALVARHEALRTVFPLVDGEPRQVVRPAAGLPLEFLDGIDLPAFQRFAAQSVRQPFDIERGPLVRVWLARFAPDRHALLFTVHHIVCDGWSLQVLTRDLARLYSVCIYGDEAVLAPLRIQYRDFAAWQNGILRGDEAEESKRYWHGKLAGHSGCLDLPLDFPRPSVADPRGLSHICMLTLEQSGGIAALTSEHGASLFMAVTALVKVLLHRYTGAEDILTGTPIAGRAHLDLKDQVGVYVNTLVLRDRVSSADSFLTILAAVKQTVIEAYDHQAYPFDRLVDELGVSRDPSRSPLFDVMVALANRDEEPSPLDGVAVSGIPLAGQVSHFDLTFAFAELAGGALSLSIEYRTALFLPSRIQRLSALFSQLLSGILENPAQPVGSIEWIPEAEAAVTRAFNQTAAPYPEDKTLVELFDEQAARTPESLAIVEGGVELSYDALRRHAERVGWYLAGVHGVEPDQRIGLLMERSAAAVVGILGALKSGGAYVPLDPAYPDRRLSELIRDSDCRAVLTNQRWAARARALSPAPVVDIESIPADIRAGTPANLSPRHLAYVIFTSGTTGSPKGVMVEHRSVANLAAWMDGELYRGLPGARRQAMLASLVFDVSVHELFGGLLRGNTLFIAGDAVKRDPRLLSEFLMRHGIEILSTTPSLLASAIEAGAPVERWPLKHLTIGAEVLPATLLDHLFARADIPVTNLYGPTECCVESTFHHLRPHSYPRDLAAPIGRPLGNVRIYVCDRQLQRVPIGVAGEICIGGVALARGYLNREDLTNQVFVPAPFDPDGRVYRTGDRGCWREDGVLLFLGRRDAQVKIRGYRIEPGEIEHHLLAIGGVRQAIVVARDANDGGSELVAYVVAHPPIPAADLRSRLSQSLPAFMVPAHFVPVDAFPLNASGKIDAKALPSPAAASPAGAAATADELEAALLRIWKEVLGTTSAGRRDNFFESGGHSLKAVRLASRIRDEFHVEVALSEIFAAPVLSQMADLLRGLRPQAAPAIEPAPAADHYPLSHAQRRLWLLGQMDKGAASYNISAAFRIEGPLDVDALGYAFACLIERHESLRTVFRLIDGEPRQRILDTLPFSLVPEDGPEDAAAEAHGAFDLARGPLFRVRLWRLGQDRHVLSLTLHHIIADAWSLDVLMHEAARLYETHRPLPPLGLQARDFACWERRARSGEETASDRKYWLRKLSGEIAPLDLPADFPRPPIKTWRGRTAGYHLPAGLEECARNNRVSLFAVLTAMVKILLHRYTGQESIVIGSAIAGRGRSELENQIGFYVETVALRDEVHTDEPVANVLGRVNTTIQEALDHSRYPFDTLVEERNVPRDLSRSPLFDVMLVFETREPLAVELKGLRISPLAIESEVSKFDLTFHFIHSRDGIQAAIEYNCDLFSSARIDRLTQHVCALAAGLIRQGCETAVGDLALMEAAERDLVETVFPAAPCTAIPDGSIADRFAVQARRTPEACAVIFEDSMLSYRQLDEQAAALAHSLEAAAGFKPGEPVAVLLERSPRAIVALLGILKARGVYLPIDPRYPPARVQRMLHESNCRIIVNGHGIELLPDKPPRPFACADAAYLIFTSGSTGNPKAVLLENRGFVNMALRQIETFGITAGDRVLQFASPAFDASLSEVFMALFAGAAVVLISGNAVASRDGFLNCLESASVTVATLPPSYLSALGRPELPGLRVLITAGEPPVLEDARFHAARLRYFNAYGPTEASVCATIHEYDRNQAEIPIGRPLANTRVYVLDSRLQPVPIGIPGEICIAGPGLAAGYINDPGQTARKFVQRGAERLYRTGDRGWWRSDGELVFAGRIDEQIKIRGHRIEPAEIEQALDTCSSVRRSLVVAQGEPRVLVAYLERRPDHAETPAASLREQLGERLPPAMIPAQFVWLDRFPTTTSGKIDKPALPAPDATTSLPIEGPRNEMESLLAAVWGRVLNVTRVGIHQSFFELGGDSIRLLQVAAALEEHGIAIEIADVYRAPTIAGLAPLVRARSVTIDQSPVTGIAPLTATQSWFFQTYRGNRNHFNQSVLLRSRKRLQEEALGAVLRAIVQHHDALRARFRIHGAAICQEFEPAAREDLLEVVSLADAVDEETALREHADRIHHSLDIEAGRVFSAALLRGTDCDRLLLVAHHLVVDGVSWRFLLEDLSAGLEQLQSGRPLHLPSRTHSLKHWAEQQHHCALHDSLSQEEPFWREVVAHHETGAGQARVCEGRNVSFELNAGETRHLLTRAGPGFGVGIDAVLLTALARAFRICGGRSHLLVTLEGHGREPIVEGIDVSRTVGWFTSIYPVRLHLSDCEGIESQVLAISHTLRETPNRGVGYGILAHLAESPVRISGGIAFNYLGQLEAPGGDAVFESEISTVGGDVDPQSARLHELDFLAGVTAGIFHLDLAYDPIRCRPADARKLVETYAAELRAVLKTSGPPRAVAHPPAVRPYMAQRVGGEPLLLNTRRRRALFAMPPLFGYGAGLRNLAALIREYSFYGLDFIEEPDRVERYVRNIRAVQPRGPYILLGYSGGGNLAFEVAKELECNGCAVSSLILLDAPLRRTPVEMSEDGIQSMMEGNLNYFRARMEAHPDYRAFVANPQMRQLMLRKMAAFIRFLNGLVNTGCIHANIHLIRSGQQWAAPADWDEWCERTTGALLTYQGTGDHAGMTDAHNVAGNAAIINRILERYAETSGQSVAPKHMASRGKQRRRRQFA